MRPLFARNSGLPQVDPHAAAKRTVMQFSRSRNLIFGYVKDYIAGHRVTRINGIVPSSTCI